MGPMLGIFSLLVGGLARERRVDASRSRYRVAQPGGAGARRYHHTVESRFSTSSTGSV
jgi:hypothetical protein